MNPRALPTRQFYAIGALALALSQVSSFLVDSSLEIGRSVPFLGPVYLTHVRNHGGIFGVWQGQGWLFALVSCVILGVVVYWVHNAHFKDRLEYLCFGLVVGGGASNILDRLIYGSVVDFIDIHGIPYWKYIFNTADVMIHLGIWPLFAFGLFGGRKRIEAEAAEAEGSELT